MGHFPSTKALLQIDIQLRSFYCGSCIGRIEDTYHILVTFPFSCLVHEQVFSWSRLHTFDVTNVKRIMQFTAAWRRCPKKREWLIMICYGMFWMLWKSSNEK